MKEAKEFILSLIREKKDILFGTFGETLTPKMKMDQWEIVTKNAHERGYLQANRDWRYVRDTVWQNWRKRTLEKINNRKSAIRGRIYELEESDRIILDIITIESPAVSPSSLNVAVAASQTQTKCQNPLPHLPETRNSTKNSRSIGNVNKIEITPKTSTVQPIKRRHIEVEHTKNLPKLNEQEMVKRILEMRVELLERECYLKDLDIFKKEKELGLPPSKFTEHFYYAIEQSAIRSGYETRKNTFTVKVEPELDALDVEIKTQE